MVSTNQNPTILNFFPGYKGGTMEFKIIVSEKTELQPCQLVVFLKQLHCKHNHQCLLNQIRAMVT